MNFSRNPKAKRILVIGLSSGTLFLITLYWILSCTLLNPAFYHYVFESGAVQTSFTDASEKMSPEGTTLFNSQSLKENAFSQIDGLLRFIKQNDMSMSSIQFESESTQSIRTAVMAAAPDKAAVMPEISRVHPYVISYFLPGSENVFTALFSVQKALSALRTVIPVMGLILLLLLLLPEKAAENTKAVCISTGIAVIFAAVILLLFQRPLLLTPISGRMSDAGVVIPIIRQAIAYWAVFTFLTGAFLFLPALAVSLQPVKRIFSRFSRTLAIFIVILVGLYVILFNNEVFANAVQTMKTRAEQFQVRILSQDDGSVHSLTIKLRETDTLAPVKNAKLSLYKMENPSEPFQISAFSDAHGNARFILPEGKFLLAADPSTIPGFKCFDPVMLSLDRPDSSWYTFYLTHNDEIDFRQETPDEGNLRFPDRPVPLLK